LPGYSSASQAPIARARLKFILGKTGYSRIADPANEVLISAIVPWEISIKMNFGEDAAACLGDGLSPGSPQGGVHLS
jgi:hypothetical protein